MPVLFALLALYHAGRLPIDFDRAPRINRIHVATLPR